MGSNSLDPSDLMQRYRRDLRQRRFRAILRLVAGILLRWTVFATLCIVAFRYLPAIGAWAVFGLVCIFWIGDVAWQVMAGWSLSTHDPLDDPTYNSLPFCRGGPRDRRANNEQYEFLESKGWRGKRNLRVYQVMGLMKEHLDVELGYAYLEKHGPARRIENAYRKDMIDSIGFVSPNRLSIQLEYRDGDSPATDKQIRFLEGKGMPFRHNLTMGEASKLAYEWAHKEFAPDVWRMDYGSKSNRV